MDQVQCKQRKRSANFTRSEVIALLHLTRKYKALINLKCTKADSNKLKEQAWEKIAVEFNSFPQNRHNQRNADVLRKKFGNMKKQQKQKRKLAQMNADKVPEDVTLPFDLEPSAESFDPEDHEIGDFKQEVCEEESEINELDSVEKSDDSVEKNDGSCGTYFSLETKQDLLELQKRCLLEEHAVKVQHMQETHNRSLQIQEQEAEERLKHMRDEHRLQMEILQLRKQCLLK